MRQRILLLILLLPGLVEAQQNVILENVYEAALDLPRILFAVQRQQPGPVLKPASGFASHFAFLDTGASGILLSRETVGQLGIRVELQAQFVDIGVGGAENFGVTEPLFLGVASFHTKNPRDLRAYRLLGRARFQVKESKGGLFSQPLDIIGMPAIMGRVVVLDTGATNNMGHCAATLLAPGSSAIPATHLGIQLRFEKFCDPENPKHVPPLPVMAPNPMIDNVVLQHRGRASKTSWLFDTGGTISLISTAQARRLGIYDAQGQPRVKPAFSLPVGGVGQMTNIPGYQFDRLVVPLVNGRTLVFTNARVGVHDIHYRDVETKQQRTLDGVFGSNFLCASAKMVGLLPGDIRSTAFNKVVIDMPRKRLGLRLLPNARR